MRHPHPAIPEFHMMPLADTGTHAFDLMCACGPWEDAPGSVMHNSFDGREGYEPGGGRKHH